MQPVIGLGFRFKELSLLGLRVGFRGIGCGGLGFFSFTEVRVFRVPVGNDPLIITKTGTPSHEKGASV